MIKSNGNLRPKPFLKHLISKGSIADNGSSKHVIATCNNRNEKYKFTPESIYNENAFSRDRYLLNKFPEIEDIYLDAFYAIKDIKDTFVLYKMKGNYVASKNAFEYSYYLIPNNAVLNDCYRVKNKKVANDRNNISNIIVELDPNYIFSENYVSNFVNKGNSVIKNDPVIPVLDIYSDGNSGFNLIDFHSYIVNRYMHLSKTSYPICDLDDGKYPVIFKGFRGNSSHFTYMAYLVVKTMKVGDVSYKQGFIFDYNSSSISDIKELRI